MYIYTVNWNQVSPRLESDETDQSGKARKLESEETQNVYAVHPMH
jgi:hypothetical protein